MTGAGWGASAEFGDQRCAARATRSEGTQEMWPVISGNGASPGGYRKPWFWNGPCRMVRCDSSASSILPGAYAGVLAEEPGRERRFAGQSAGDVFACGFRSFATVIGEGGSGGSPRHRCRRPLLMFEPQCLLPPWPARKACASILWRDPPKKSRPAAAALKITAAELLQGSGSSILGCLNLRRQQLVTGPERPNTCVRPCWSVDRGSRR